MNDNVVIIIFAAVFVVIAIAVNFYIGIEVVQLIREVFGHMSEDARSRKMTASRNRKVEQPPGRQIEPFQDRETVERIINHLEEETAE